MLGLPNLPDRDLKPGGKENNEPLRYFGEHRTFDFEPKNHVDLCTDLGLIDYKRGTKLAGNGFWIYRGMGARLEWALLNYFIEEHLKDGYEFILPPHMLEYQCGQTAGQFPKFADEVYKIANPTDDRVHYMLPTAEAALASLYRDEVLSEADLPKKLFSYTPCFRREAGSYRSDERGMVRGHQFNKVEMFQYTLPEKSDEAFDELVAKAENLVKGLGFHFRTVKLAAEDCSASMARTYDIEINIPSMNGYKEVFLGFQRAGLPGAPRHDPCQAGQRQGGICAHAQRLRTCNLPDSARTGRAESERGRLGQRAGRAPQVHRCGRDPQELRVYFPKANVLSLLRGTLPQSSPVVALHPLRCGSARISGCRSAVRFAVTGMLLPRRAVTGSREPWRGLRPVKNGGEACKTSCDVVGGISPVARCCRREAVGFCAERQ